MSEHGTRPGEGPNDQPATTGTHRGWGDPQPGELEHREEEKDEQEEGEDEEREPS